MGNLGWAIDWEKKRKILKKVIINGCKEIINLLVLGNVALEIKEI